MRSLFILFFLFFSEALFAKPISYSGRLVDASGVPVAGPVNLQFDILVNASPVCSVAVSSVNLDNGVFNVSLDYGTSCVTNTKSLEKVIRDAEVGGDSLAIQVTETDTPVTYPAQTISSTPRALFATKAQEFLMEVLPDQALREVQRVQQIRF
jgi:hypothetical protein